MNIVNKPLEGKCYAILATDGFEPSELQSPCEALKSAGASVEIISLEQGHIRGFNHKEWGPQIKVDAALADADAANYDGLVLPGGVMNPDTLRAKPEAVEFVKSFVKAGKPIAAICHGPWTLVEAGAVRGRTLTSWPSLRTDIVNAGGDWIDQEVVTDHGLVTSRKPDDLPAFNAKMIEEFTEGPHRPAHRISAEAAANIRM